MNADEEAITAMQDALDANPTDELGWRRLEAKMRAIGNLTAAEHCRQRGDHVGPSNPGNAGGREGT